MIWQQTCSEITFFVSSTKIERVKIIENLSIIKNLIKKKEKLKTINDESHWNKQWKHNVNVL